MVRAHYVPVDASVFRELFKHRSPLAGGRFEDDISVFRPDAPYIRGSGWFTRIAVPIFRKYIAPNLLEFGSNFLSNIASGQSPKSSAKRRGLESLKKTAKKIMTGRGKKLKTVKKKIKKRRHANKKTRNLKLGGKKIRKNPIRKNIYMFVRPPNVYLTDVFSI